VYPEASVFSLLGSFVIWFVYRFVMISCKHKPPVVSSSLMMSFIYILPAFPFTMAICNLFFVAHLNKTYRKDYAPELGHVDETYLLLSRLSA
jgi:hypothetical protein